MKKWIDVTHPIHADMVYWPGQDKPEIERIASIDNGDDANVTKISISVHTGTHIDAPLHFIDNAEDITAMPIDAMTGNALVFEMYNGGHITKDDIQEAEGRMRKLREGDKVLFKTPFSDKDWINQPFQKDYPAVTAEAANYLAEKKIKVVGNDYLTIAPFSKLIEVHHILLGARIWIIEGLNLKKVKEQEYEILALPLKIKGSDGSPARVLLREL